jgi:hypothetical protein
MFADFLVQQEGRQRSASPYPPEPSTSGSGQAQYSHQHYPPPPRVTPSMPPPMRSGEGNHRPGEGIHRPGENIDADGYARAPCVAAVASEAASYVTSHLEHLEHLEQPEGSNQPPEDDAFRRSAHCSSGSAGHFLGEAPGGSVRGSWVYHPDPGPDVHPQADQARNHARASGVQAARAETDGRTMGRPEPDGRTMGRPEPVGRTMGRHETDGHTMGRAEAEAEAVSKTVHAARPQLTHLLGLEDGTNPLQVTLHLSFVKSKC